MAHRGAGGADGGRRALHLALPDATGRQRRAGQCPPRELPPPRDQPLLRTQPPAPPDPTHRAGIQDRRAGAGRRRRARLVAGRGHRAGRRGRRRRHVQSLRSGSRPAGARGQGQPTSTRSPRRRQPRPHRARAAAVGASLAVARARHHLERLRLSQRSADRAARLPPRARHHRAPGQPGGRRRRRRRHPRRPLRRPGQGGLHRPRLRLLDPLRAPLQDRRRARRSRRARRRVGEVGRTGRATGYHVHYEVYEEGQSKNPLEHLLD